MGPGSDGVATHAYATAGVYTVTVVVTDSAGRSSTNVMSVIVAPETTIFHVTPIA